MLNHGVHDRNLLQNNFVLNIYLLISFYFYMQKYHCGIIYMLYTDTFTYLFCYIYIYKLKQQRICT